MVKLQKTVRNTFIMSIPKDIVAAMGWKEDEKFSLCPGENGVLRVVPLFKRGDQRAG